MRTKAFFALAIATGVSSIMMVSFVCYTHWPDKDSSLPSWVQAIGGIVAILVAGLGIGYQLSHSEDAEQQRRERELRNMLRALGVEAKSYGQMLAQIQIRMSNDWAMVLTMRLQVTFPPIEPRFSIYEACAPLLGAINDDQLLSDVVFFYAETIAFLSALNRNSALAATIPHDAAPDEDLGKKLSQMGPQLEAQLKTLLDVSARVNTGIAAAIARPLQH